jgi:hypothetical protein
MKAAKGWSMSVDVITRIELLRGVERDYHLSCDAVSINPEYTTANLRRILSAEAGLEDEHMDLAKLVTMNFDKNVGTADRVFRIVSGIGLAAAGWSLGLATWHSIIMTVLGVMWTASGVLSRCSIYYMIGYSTCPISGERFSTRRL